MTLYTNARIIDGTGALPKDNQAVLVKDKRIAAVGAEAEIVQAHDLSPEQRIDLKGRTLLPGFIDCHIHIMWNPDPKAPFQRRTNIPLRDEDYWKARNLLYAINACRMTIEAGFTTVQDLGNPNDTSFALRDAIANGEHVGPRLLASGKCITHTGGHGVEGSDWRNFSIVADGPDEIFKAVRQQITAGADVIKYMGGTRPALSAPFRGRQGYTTEEMKPGVEEAHRAGLRVATHAHSSLEGIKNSILAGVDSIEHGFPLDDEAAGWMVERGTFLCPTLSVNPASLEAIRLGLWPFGEQSVAQVHRMADAAPKAIQAAKKAGVKIALGTDAAMPMVMHGGNAKEFEYMVEYGLTPMESILAGTRNAAENLRLIDQIGTVEAGKLADLVVVDGDPLADIRILQNQSCIKLVLKEGAVVIDRGAAQ
jgi:imidazolonepropionase-like amidohydrolase